MGEIQRFQNEHHPFYFIIASLQDPYGFGVSTVVMEENMKSSTQYIVDRSEIWEYRTKLLIFFNGLVSSSHLLRERMKVRKMLEVGGFKKVLNTLKIHDPTKAFTIQMNSYLEDRKQDLNEQENIYQVKNASLKNASSEFKDLIKQIDSLPQPEMARNFVMSTLTNVSEILKGVYPKDQEKVTSEERSFVFSILKNSTKSLANSVNQWEKDPESKNIQELQKSFMNSIDSSMTSYGSAVTNIQPGNTSNAPILYKELERVKKKVFNN
jgi:hypothetical protein